MTDTPKPTELSLHQKSRVLEISYADGERFELSYEFLRVHSPSAEVQGHGPGQGVLQSRQGRRHDLALSNRLASYAIQPSLRRRPRHRHLFLGYALRPGQEPATSYWQAYLQTSLPPQDRGTRDNSELD